MLIGRSLTSRTIAHRDSITDEHFVHPIGRLPPADAPMTTAQGVLVEAPSPRRTHLEAAELVGGILAHAPDGPDLRFLPELDRLCSALAAEPRARLFARRPAAPAPAAG